MTQVQSYFWRTYFWWSIAARGDEDDWMPTKLHLFDRASHVGERYGGMGDHTMEDSCSCLFASDVATPLETRTPNGSKFESRSLENNNAVRNKNPKWLKFRVQWSL